MALEAGASAEDILAVLRAVAPQVGTARVVAAAPELMLALGHDASRWGRACVGPGPVVRRRSLPARERDQGRGVPGASLNRSRASRRLPASQQDRGRELRPR